MKDDIRSRFLALIIGLVFFVAVVFFRIIYLQSNVAANELKEEIGQQFEYRTISVNSERGNIYDRAGYLLAGNSIAYTVSLNLQYSNGHGEFYANYLAPILNIEREKVISAAEVPYVERKAVEMPLTNFASSDQIEKIEQAKKSLSERASISLESKTRELANLNGVVYYPNIYRYYPNDDLAANIIGFYPYLNPANGASYGIEQYYDEILSGKTIQKQFSMNPNIPDEIPAIPKGASIVLTIDRQIQSIVEQLIDQSVEHNKAKSGTIVLSNIKTGEILAMATSPRINLNQYWKSATEFTRDNKFNPAVMQPYETGSVFKVITFASALDCGAVKPDTVFIDTGTYDIMGVSIYNWDRGAWGPQSMAGCMQHSLNTCLSWMSEQIGTKRFYDYLKAFQVNIPTGIELALEDYYPMLEPGDSGWTEISRPTNSFGQGIMATPIQMIRAIGAIANDGIMMQPHIVKEIHYDDHTEYVEPQVVGHPIKPETSKIVTEILTRSLEVEASDALVYGMRVAGKTGTGEIAKEGLGYVLSVTNASFVGWFPVDDPEYMMYVWLQEPLTSIWGSEVSAPLFSEVTTKVMPYLHLPNDRQRACLYTDVCPTQEPINFYY